MPELYPEDQERVNKVISEGMYKPDHKPFKPWTLLSVIVVALGLITVVSFWISSQHGYV